MLHLPLGNRNRKSPSMSGPRSKRASRMVLSLKICCSHMWLMCNVYFLVIKFRNQPYLWLLIHIALERRVAGLH